MAVLLDPHDRRPPGSLNQPHVLSTGAHGIQQTQPSPAPVGPDHDSRSGKEHEDLAAVDSNRAGL